MSHMNVYHQHLFQVDCISITFHLEVDVCVKTGFARQTRKCQNSQSDYGDSWRLRLTTQWLWTCCWRNVRDAPIGRRVLIRDRYLDRFWIRFDAKKILYQVWYKPDLGWVTSLNATVYANYWSNTWSPDFSFLFSHQTCMIASLLY